MPGVCERRAVLSHMVGTGIGLRIWKPRAPRPRPLPCDGHIPYSFPSAKGEEGVQCQARPSEQAPRGVLWRWSQAPGLLVCWGRRQSRASVVPAETVAWGQRGDGPHWLSPWLGRPGYRVLLQAPVSCCLPCTPEQGRPGDPSGTVSVRARFDGAPSAVPTSSYIIPRPPACS